jgi:XTP/dITP diphosphohydrolase
MRRIVLATRNGNKVRELNTILADVIQELDLEIVGMGEFPDVPGVVETGVTFAQNATLKAVAAVKATGLPALADDSGLAVDVLGGAPGVFSGRWAGTHGQDGANIELLLGQLYDVPEEHRSAAFVCAAVLAMPDGRVVVREGRMPGLLARSPRGDNGFGYDPVMIVDGSRTSAELSFEEKNAISHRGKAFRALAADLEEVLAER